MVKLKLKILDLKCGNINSVLNIFNFLGCDVEIINNLKKIDEASGLIIPGNGNYDHVSKEIRKLDINRLFDYVLDKQKPTLGICIGLQLFFSRGFENNTISNGLNFFEGDIIKLKNQLNKKNIDFSLPHIGWNNIKIKKNSNLLKDIKDNESFYFLHSYACTNISSEFCVAKTSYGNEFVAIMEKKNIVGLQFHPEKSHDNGVKILKNWIENYVKD